jgi:thioredoxin:protein disulfide reductase
MRFLFLISALLLATLASGADPQQSLRELLGGGAKEDEPLPAERAFVMKAQAVAPDAVAVSFTPAPTYYLYRSKFAFAVAQPPQVKVQDVQLPGGEVKDDPIFGRTEVYHQSVQALVSLQSPSPLPREVELSVTMQGCTERGLCYPPDTRRVKVRLAAAAVGAAPPATHVPAPDASTAQGAPAASPRGRWAALALLLAGAGALAVRYARRGRRG